MRVDLAAAYRLAAQRGWDDTVYTHLSASVPGEPGVYLINPFGCASTRSGVEPGQGRRARRVVDGSGAPVNPSGFAIHGAVHAARPDAACVIHLHTPWGVALSMLPEGLLPASQFALRLGGRLGRHAYEGLAFASDERARLVANLGNLDGLILDNHGTLTVGRTVAEAWMLMYLLERAAQAQLAAMAATGGAAWWSATRSPSAPGANGSATAASSTAMPSGRRCCAAPSALAWIQRLTRLKETTHAHHPRRTVRRPQRRAEARAGPGTDRRLRARARRQRRRRRRVVLRNCAPTGPPAACCGARCRRRLLRPELLAAARSGSARFVQNEMGPKRGMPLRVRLTNGSESLLETQAAAACNLTPSARATLRTVAKLGLPSALSAR